MKKVYIETMGCQMNKSDAERMYGMLEYCGYTQTENPKEADMLLVNTCSIRKLYEYKAAKKYFVKAMLKKPNEPDFYYNLALTYKKLNNPEKEKEAMDVYKKLKNEEI